MKFPPANNFVIAKSVCYAVVFKASLNLMKQKTIHRILPFDDLKNVYVDEQKVPSCESFLSSGGVVKLRGECSELYNQAAFLSHVVMYRNACKDFMNSLREHGDEMYGLFSHIVQNFVEDSAKYRIPISSKQLQVNLCFFMKHKSMFLCCFSTTLRQAQVFDDVFDEQEILFWKQ